MKQKLLLTNGWLGLGLCWLLFSLPSYTQPLPGSAGYQGNSVAALYTNPGQGETSKLLKDVLVDMEQQYQVFFIYDTRLVKGKQVETEALLSSIVKGEDVEQVLNTFLPKFDLHFKKLKENFYLIYEETEGRSSTESLRKVESSKLQDYNSQFSGSVQSLPGIRLAISPSLAKTVRGQVTDGENAAPIPGVNVLAKGTTTGTVTDIDGNYSLTVDDDVTVLVFSSIGYVAQEVEINGRQNIDITLSADVQSLEEVVVIGYGTQEKRDLTGSVASVSSEEITQLPNVNLAQALQGRAPGVVVTENSGRPGASATVQIRGVGTVGNSNPLYVVDGQILSTGLDNINPNDIASMEILKDASAAAIYGARAANGVVLITTKRGQAGETKVSYNGYYGPQVFNDRLEWMTAEEFVRDDIRRAGSSGEQSPWASEGDPSQFGQGENYWDKLWRTGYITDHNLSLSGGNENSRFLLSLGYLSNRGVMIGQSFDRYSVRLNTDHNIGSWLKIGQSLQVSKSNEVAVGGFGGYNAVFEGGWRMVPTIVPERFPDGSWNGPTRPGEPFTFSTFSPNQYVEEWDDLRKQWQGLGNVFAEVEFVKGLTFRTTFSGLFGFNDQTGWNPQLTNAGGSGNSTSLSRNTNVTTNWQLDNILSYTHSFNAHHLSVLAGYTAQENRYENLNVSASNFLDESVNVVNGSNTENRNASGGIEDWSLNSIIGRITYDFDNRYLIQANMRADGSSRFGAGNRWGYFPSFSAGWRISEENFFNIAAINDLKIRGSWGQLGNDQIGLYAFAAAVNLSQNYTLGEGQNIRTGAAPTQLANSNIKWEETTQFDIGLDMSLFDDSWTLTADYFIKETDDMLLQVPIALSSGYTDAPFVNAGSVKNVGWELSTTYRSYQGDFTWDATLNLSGVQNEITALGQGERIIRGANNGDQVADVGTEVFAFFGYVADGLYQNQAEIDAVNALNPEREYDPGAVPGAVRFKDINNDGLITDEDRTVIGSPYADLSYGLNFNAQYGNFDLSLFLQGTWGNDILMANNDNFAIQPGGRLRYNLDRWFEDGDTNDAVLWGVGGFQNASGGRDGRAADYMVFDGSYIRGKNLQIGYTVPATLLDRLGVSRLRVYVSSKNFFTLWDTPEYNFIFDPELGAEGSGFGKFNLVTTPQTTTFLFGVNLNF
ncbi:MAG: TonB-dependent receptor [Cyclobacteriaceae bacterium]